MALEPRDASLTRWCVVTVIAGGLLVTIGVGRGRQRRRSRDWLAGAIGRVAHRGGEGALRGAGVAGWITLVAAFVGWDAFSFSQERADLPTLSRLLGLVTASAGGRGILAVAWVAWGAWVGGGWRVRR